MNILGKGKHLGKYFDHGLLLDLYFKVQKPFSLPTFRMRMVAEDTSERHFSLPLAYGVLKKKKKKSERHWFVTCGGRVY